MLCWQVMVFTPVLADALLLILVPSTSQWCMSRIMTGVAVADAARMHRDWMTLAPLAAISSASA
jgi:hypothetical protein